jgi:2-polyprenyl-3-methyl-5-hydroxy-6-metoxy-1,4-benzoquinol methylase
MLIFTMISFFFFHFASFCSSKFMRRNAADHGNHHFTPPLFNQRLRFVSELVGTHCIQSVLDVGCSEGQLLHYLIMSYRKEKSLRRYSGIDASRDALFRASASAPTSMCPTELLHPCEINFVQGDISQANLHPSHDVVELLRNKFELIACVEVVEHIPKARLGSFLSTLFGFLASTCNAKVVVLTTPNRDYNWKFGAGEQLRHDDHKFELSHSQFVRLCVAIQNIFLGWDVELSAVGAGATQCAAFYHDGTASSQLSETKFDELCLTIGAIFEGHLDDAAQISLTSDEIDGPLKIFLPHATVVAVDVWERLRRASIQYATRLHYQLRSNTIVLQVGDVACSPELMSDLELTPSALFTAMQTLRKSLVPSHLAKSRCSLEPPNITHSFQCCCSTWVPDSYHLIESALGLETVTTWLNDSLPTGKTPIFEVALILANLGYCFNAGSPISIVLENSQHYRIVANRQTVPI